METLVFFLVIGALQLLASYIKQKKEKEAARKAPPQAPPRPQPSLQRRSAPPEAAPLPDPLKEIMRHLGVPEAPPAPPQVEKREKAPAQNKPDLVAERPTRSFEQAHKTAHTDTHYMPEPAKAAEPSEAAEAAKAPELGDLGLSVEDTAKAADKASRSSLQGFTSPEDLRKGIIWTTILQEPRFRRPWRIAHP